MGRARIRKPWGGGREAACRDRKQNRNVMRMRVEEKEEEERDGVRRGRKHVKGLRTERENWSVTLLLHRRHLVSETSTQNHCIH